LLSLEEGAIKDGLCQKIIYYYCFFAPKAEAAQLLALTIPRLEDYVGLCAHPVLLPFSFF